MNNDYAVILRPINVCFHILYLFFFGIKMMVKTTKFGFVSESQKND